MTIQEIREMRKTKSRLNDTINKLYNLFDAHTPSLPYKISNCCYAPPLGETCDDLGYCSECHEGAVFNYEEKENNEME